MPQMPLVSDGIWSGIDLQEWIISWMDMGRQLEEIFKEQEKLGWNFERPEKNLILHYSMKFTMELKSEI